MADIDLVATLATAAAIGLVNLWVALRVTRIRIKDKVLLGDGGQDLLTGRMRAHANLVEYAPFVLILMGLLELSGGSSVALAVAGALFVVSRIAHAVGMDLPSSNAARAGGAVLTWLIFAFLIGWAALVAIGVSA
ncbi:MAPEG family protein [Croceicoccus sp. F390]|uniref:MAPEG family protein n=1 Tax=Croceicoccus esteveae TaxID=3075597 RepID=A0ABU2ZI03_9SPHN|nr:MAPEG family protein [Croceicoccus sp. F390]MDT0575929.1 MAPEG family protein [Croceicoccus sp. F390]